MKLSNDVEKYEIEVTKMGQKYTLFLAVLAMSTAIHFCCVPFPKLGNESCDFCRYPILAT